jgi:lipopolysaccharide heptosyltransferase I
VRVLIVRTSALGDVVHALPVLTALRRHLPEARIGWVVEEAMAPVLEGHPDLDERITVRLRAWGRRPFAADTRRGVARFLADLGRFAPDVVLDLMGNHKSAGIAALTLADRRIGAARRHRREPASAVWINEPVVPRGIHAVDRMLSLLAPLGVLAEPADFAPGKLFTSAPPPPAPPAPSEPFALLHPGAGWGNKIYPPAWWGRAVRRLRELTGAPTRIATARGEECLASEVEAASGGAARQVPAGGLPELAALIRSSRLVLGGDSGPTHLAHALGIPVLMLMGPTDPARNGPYGAPHLALWKTLPCSFCHRRLGETKACLLEIPPGRVAERAAEILRAAR